MRAGLGRARGAAFLLAIVIVGAAVQFAVPTAKAKELMFVIEMRSVRFFPELLAVDPGDVVTVVVFNNDTLVHTFDLPAHGVHLGTVAAPMPPGENRSATFTASSEGTFWFFCSVTGHSAQRGDGTYTGMAGRLVVGQPRGGQDLTLIAVVVGVVAALAGAVGVLVWRRRRAPRP